MVLLLMRISVIHGCPHTWLSADFARGDRAAPRPRARRSVSHAGSADEHAGGGGESCRLYSHLFTTGSHQRADRYGASHVGASQIIPDEASATPRDGIFPKRNPHSILQTWRIFSRRKACLLKWTACSCSQRHQGSIRRCLQSRIGFFKACAPDCRGAELAVSYCPRRSA